MATRNAAGYMVVRTERGIEYEHRVVWEAIHGPIPPGFHIHHKNRVRHDNRPENLELVDASAHNRDHTSERHADGSLNNRGPQSGRWLDLDDDLIVRRREAGASFREIGRDLGVSWHTVANHYRAKTVEDHSVHLPSR